MKTTLHLGAHRTASSSVQRCLIDNAALLARRHVTAWTPADLRRGMLQGIYGDPSCTNTRRATLAKRATGRLALKRATLADSGTTHLVISEENLLGALRENTGLSILYPTAALRLRRLAQVIPDVTRIGLAVRSYDSYWASAFAFLMGRGAPVPQPDQIARVLTQSRRWRHLVTEIATNFPAAHLTVWSFEAMAGQPQAVAAHLTGVPLPTPARQLHLNASPTVTRLADKFGVPNDLPNSADHYAPFSPDQRAHLRALYAEDIAWLRAGAAGRATFIDRPGADPAAPPVDTEGPHHDRSQRALG